MKGKNQKKNSPVKKKAAKPEGAAFVAPEHQALAEIEFAAKPSGALDAAKTIEAGKQEISGSVQKSIAEKPVGTHAVQNASLLPEFISSNKWAIVFTLFAMVIGTLAYLLRQGLSQM